MEDAFVQERLLIRKGEYKIMLSDCWRDVLDIHGLCATAELAEYTILNLEFGDNYLVRSTPLMRLSKAEKAQIYQKINALRGPHSCVHIPERCVIDYDSPCCDEHGPLMRRILYHKGVEQRLVKSAHLRNDGSLRVCAYTSEHQAGKVVITGQRQYVSTDWRIHAVDGHGFVTGVIG